MKEKRMTLSTKLNFGKHKGETIYDLLRDDPDYVEWLLTIWEGEIDWKVEKYFKSQQDKPSLPTNTLSVLPGTDLKVPAPNNKTISIDGLPIKVLKSFLMFKEDQIIYYNDLFKYFTLYAISSLFQKQYIKIK